MEVTEEGIVTEVNPVQSLKADNPIVITDGGIITDVNPVQEEKA
jgi:hypothetical protein